MEKTPNDVVSFSNLPLEIQQYIATYLDAPSLGFFGMSNKQRLKMVLPLLRNYQAMLSLRLISKGGDCNYLYQTNQQFFVCGANGYGQLGLGDEKHLSTFTGVPWLEERGQIKQVIASYNQAFVLTQDNKLWVCGSNYSGQLGLSDEVKQATHFTEVIWPAKQGKIQQIIVGNNHTVVLTDDHRLWGCGDNCYGQLGLGDKVKQATFFTEVPWPAERGSIKQVIAGGYHTIVLTKDNHLWVCGWNPAGQLGLSNEVEKATHFTKVAWLAKQGNIQQIIAGLHHTVVLTDDHRLWVCGDMGFDTEVEQDALFSEVPWPAERGSIQQVIAGGYHTIVLTKDNRLWVCGYNRYGQLGLSDKVEQATHFTEVAWPTKQGKIQQIIAGQHHTVVLTDDQRLWGCGDNKNGQLGLGDKVKRANAFTLITVLVATLQQVLTLNNHLNQLITLGAALMQTLGTESGNFHSKRQPDESKDQSLLKTMRL